MIYHFYNEFQFNTSITVIHLMTGCQRGYQLSPFLFLLYYGLELFSIPRILSFYYIKNDMRRVKLSNFKPITDSRKNIIITLTELVMLVISKVSFFFLNFSSTYLFSITFLQKLTILFIFYFFHNNGMNLSLFLEYNLLVLLVLYKK